MTISDINFTTTKIKILKSGEALWTASGFFFRHNNIKYLATNRHVIIDEEEKHFPDALQIRLHTDRNELTKNEELEIPLYKGSKRLWLQHPEYSRNRCDAILIPLDKTSLKKEGLIKFNSTSITFIGSEIINTKDVNSFVNVVVVGYPLGFCDEINNLPVYRKAMISSCYGVNFKGAPYFLIDANLHEGTSGSPVVNSPHTLFKDGKKKEGFTFFGIHSAEHIVDKDPLGLNVVWYGHLLVEIANQQIAQQIKNGS